MRKHRNDKPRRLPPLNLNVSPHLLLGAKNNGVAGDSPVLKIAFDDEATKQVLGLCAEMGFESPKAMFDRAIDLMTLLHDARKREATFAVAEKDGTAYAVDIFTENCGDGPAHE